jgi:hypothetical protein
VVGVIFLCGVVCLQRSIGALQILKLGLYFNIFALNK